MSAYCSSIPKYDHNLSTAAAKPIAIVLKEHIKRYGKSTVDTAKKFTKGKNREEGVSKLRVHCETTAEQAQAKERAQQKQMWEEMIANCGEVSRQWNSFQKHTKITEPIPPTVTEGLKFHVGKEFLTK